MKYLIVSIMILIVGCGAPENEKNNVRRGEYLGLTLADDQPVRFGDEWIATGWNERDMAWMPDGKTFYFTLASRQQSTICVVTRTEKGWTRPQVAPFSGLYSDLEPFISPDGRFFYFVSNRLASPTDSTRDYDIWVMEWLGEKWGDAVNLGEPVNTPANEFYPSVTRDYTLYWTAEYDNTVGGEDIYRAPWQGDHYGAPENLGKVVNSERGEFNSLIAPDESFLVFSTWGREGDLGGGDLYISFRDSADTWTEPKNLGAPINTPALDYCPALSPDGRFFFFTSRRTATWPFPGSQPTYDQLLAHFQSPGNGNDDIYWVEWTVLRP